MHDKMGGCTSETNEYAASSRLNVTWFGQNRRYHLVAANPNIHRVAYEFKEIRQHGHSVNKLHSDKNTPHSTVEICFAIDINPSKPVSVHSKLTNRQKH